MINKFKNVFSIDARALAIFRICIALILVFDLIVRSFALVAHYTDLGTLPLDFYFKIYQNTGWISIHLLNGSILFQSILFVITGLFAVSLLLGYKTKLATIVSWFLLISLQSRNPTVLQGGDIMLRVLLFWAMFIPLNLRYSFDARRNRIENNQKNILSFGTAGILLQVAFVYLFSALLKTGNEWFPNGTAIYYSLQADQFVTYIGKFLLGFPDLMILLTYFTYFLELIGPILLFMPLFFKQFRNVTTFAFIILLVGMALCLNLGHFPFVGLTAFILFLPSSFWDKLAIKLRFLKERQTHYYELDYQKNNVPPHLKRRDLIGTCFLDARNFFQKRSFCTEVCLCPQTSCAQSVPHTKVYGFQTLRHKKRRSKIFFNSIVLFFIIYIFLWNVQSLEKVNAVPDKIEFIAHGLRIDQYWNMFSPYPLKDDGWYVIDGTLVNGKHVDLLTGNDITYKKPTHVADLYVHERWRKYLMNLWQRDFSHHRPYYLNYLCNNWNGDHLGDEWLQNVTMNFMLETTKLDYGSMNIEKVVLEEVDC